MILKIFKTFTYFQLLLNVFSSTTGTLLANTVALKTTTLSPLPIITVSLNVTKVELREPFTVSCKVENYVSNKKPYFVKFFSNKNGLLARYELLPNSSRPFIVAEIHSDVRISLGKHTEYPVFDVQIVELVNSEQHYWCSFEVPKEGNLSSSTYNSTVWEHINIEFSHLTNITGNDQYNFNGRCTLKHFQPMNRTYNVQFHMTDVGHAHFLVANYSVVTNSNQHQMPEILYVHSHSQYWSAVKPGANRDFPHFDIIVVPLANASTVYHLEEKKWWCEVGVGVDGLHGYELFKSNIFTKKAPVIERTTKSLTTTNKPKF